MLKKIKVKIDDCEFTPFMIDYDFNEKELRLEVLYFNCVKLLTTKLMKVYKNSMENFNSFNFKDYYFNIVVLNDSKVYVFINSFIKLVEVKHVNRHSFNDMKNKTFYEEFVDFFNEGFKSNKMNNKIEYEFVKSIFIFKFNELKFFEKEV